MRRVLIRKGFNPATHAIISYATTIDMQIFWKILAGLDQPFVASTAKEDFCLGKERRTSLQPVNVYYLARNMMKSKTYRLRNVYRYLYGLENIEIHRADVDTMIMLNVVRALVAL